MQRTSLSEERHSCKFIFNIHPVGITVDIDAFIAGRSSDFKNSKATFLFYALGFAFLHQITVKPGAAGCIILVILFHYFSLTNFFWMLVEGKIDGKVNVFRQCALSGALVSATYNI